MSKKTNKQSRIDSLSEKYSGISSLLKSVKDGDKKRKEIISDMSEVSELMELNKNKSEFNPHGEYTIIYYKGIKYELTFMQSMVIKYMYEQHKSGKEEILDSDIFAYINTAQTSMSAIFKKTEIMNNVIIRVINHYYKLNIAIPQ